MKDYSQRIFGRSLNELTFNNIQDFFSDPQEESNILEFKSFAGNAEFDKGFKVILKTITAFLNAEGGITIWGAPSGKKVDGQPEPIFQGPLTPLPVKGKDWIINKISSGIVPMPIGIEVAVLEIEGKAVYVFQVQESIFKPHQLDHIYYIRLDGQTKPAPHFIVQALMRQISFPDLRGVIKFTELKFAPNGDRILSFTLGIFNFSELQNEEDVSFRILILGGKFVNYMDRTDCSMGGQNRFLEKPVNILHYGNPRMFFDRIVLNENENIMVMVLSFGGKFSPAKSSTYTLNIRDLKEDNLKDCITERIENVLFADQAKISKEEALSKFLETP